MLAGAYGRLTFQVLDVHLKGTLKVAQSERKRKLSDT